jgi:hypothetical protein
MPRYSIKAILIFTAVMAVIAAICIAIPVFEFRDSGYTDFPWKSLIPRRATLREAAIRIAWAAPLVSFLLFMSSRRRKAVRDLRGHDR